VHVERLQLGPLETNCWLVAEDAASPLVGIDPADDDALLLDAVGDREVTAVVLTHGHFDHLGAARALMARTGAPLLVHCHDAYRVTSAETTGGALFGFPHHHSPAPDRLLNEGDVVVVAPGLDLAVLHTPGHTEGSICLLGEGHLFSGDTLFAGSVGRTDFPGGDSRALRDSIATKLAPLPDETVVHPGHGPDTTIGRERRVNPFFPRA
jgi:glyoxylase-like metal-dependent hydrolase (beta-lactamase superfamily II)